MALDSFRSTHLGSIRELHHAHERRIADARLARRARVAIADRSIKRSDIADLLTRCGGEIVRAAEEATILLAATEEARKRKRRGTGRQRVVDLAGLQALVEAYEAVYLPAALLEATRRARQRLASDMVAAELARSQREQSRTTRRTQESVQKGTVSEAEQKLEEHVRGLRAKRSGGSLVRR